LLIEKELIQKAKEKLGDQNAFIIVEELGIENFDERNLKCKSPYRQEDTPSFVFNRKNYTFHDFGGDGITIDLIDVYMQKGMTYIQAVQKLFEKADMSYSFGEINVKTKAQYKYPHDESGDMKQVYEYWGKRGISKDTIDYLNIGSDGTGNSVFKYYDTNDVLTMVKYRPAKSIPHGQTKIWCQKDSDTSPLLFNMNRINVNQPLLIVEGEPDAMSAIEAGYYNTVSVPLGAGNFHWIEENWDWIEQFNSIIIASDNDDAGLKMRRECIYRLGSWRTKYVEIPKEFVSDNGKKTPINDMNDTLQKFGSSYVLAMIINAKETPVDSVVDFSDVEDIDISTIDGITTGIDVLDKELMRLFYGTFNILTGVNGGGKSSFLGQLTCNSIEQGKDVWMYSGEMPNYLTKNWIDSIFAGTRNVTEHTNTYGSKYYTINREAKKKISEHYKKHFYLYKDECANGVEDIKKSMEDCVRKFGCKLFILDNMSSINLDCTDDSKWQKQVDLINWMISFAKKYHVVVFLVIHPKKIETMRRLTKFDVQGLGTSVDLAHRLFSLYRVQKKEKEDTKNPIKYDVLLDVLKDRLRGREGLDVGMYYDNPSRRFYTSESEYNRQYSWDDTVYNDKLPNPRSTPFD
jgi:twinkle protein